MKPFLSFVFLLIQLFGFGQINSEYIEVEEKDKDLLQNYLPDLEINASDAAYVKKWNRTKFYVKSVYDYSLISSAMLISFISTINSSEANSF